MKNLSKTWNEVEKVGRGNEAEQISSICGRVTYQKFKDSRYIDIKDNFIASLYHDSQASQYFA